jgi:hypothetical protein
MSKKCNHNYKEEKIVYSDSGSYVVYKCTKCGDRYTELLGLNKGDLTK